MLKIKQNILLGSVIFTLLITGCSQSLQIPSLKNLPPVPKGKARVVHVFSNTADMWKIFPVYISVDRKPVAKVNSKRFSVIELESGSRMLSYFQEKAVGARDGIIMYFLEGQTRYMLCEPMLQTDRPDFYGERFSLNVREISAVEAENLLR